MGAVFRIEKTKDFTVMSNHHLRNTSLSLKAKGLLSLILSLPDNWDYTVKGLSKICKEGVDSIGTAINELEKEGYITRTRVRNAKGQLTTVEYIISEQPKLGLPKQEKPKRENPEQANPRQENPDQLNTNKSNTDLLNKDLIKYQSIKDTPDVDNSENQSGWIDRYNKINSEVKEQIDYIAIYS